MYVSIRSLRKKEIDDLIFLEKSSFLDKQEIIRFDSDRLRKVVSKIDGFAAKTLLSFSRLFGREPFKVFIAEVNGKVVGVTVVDLSRKVGYIQRVMVHPNFRGKGIATKLMTETLCSMQGKTRQAVLHVASTNKPAKGLFRKLGFSKFENLLYLFARADSLHKQIDTAGIYTREARMSEYSFLCPPTRAHVYSQSKILSKSIDFHFVSDTFKGFVDRAFQHLMITRSEKRIVAMDNDILIGYADLSCTNNKEAGRIKNIHVLSRSQYEKILGAIIEEGLNHMKIVGANNVLTLVSQQDFKLIQFLEKMGFKRWLKMEGMILRFN